MTPRKRQRNPPGVFSPTMDMEIKRHPPTEEYSILL
jgi:hypothetical protein